MNETIRLPRISKALHKEIAIILQKKIQDPRLRSIITVNHIEISRDFLYAKVFITFLDIKNNPIEISRKMQVLQKASGYIRILLAKKMCLRIIPQLTFIYDSFVYNAVDMYDFISDVLINKEKHEGH
ncbi:MAG: 30S ribosome-binding factor RbfA [Candidatus Dasytiphilus stammeri]